MSGAHASLGASSAYRWMRCSASPGFIAKLAPEDRRDGSVYAAEGSAAHSLAEHCLRTSKPAAHWLGLFLRPAEESAGGGHYLMATDEADMRTPGRGELQTGDWSVTEEMAEAVQVYLDTIAAEIAARPGALHFVEERVYPLPDRPDMFGTADLILWDFVDGLLVVTDLKFGKGVVVTVEHNLQAMYYGLGAMQKLGLRAEDVAEVELVIVQPRADHEDGPVRRWRLSARELVEWGGTLRAAADLTTSPQAKFDAGDWCKFCPAAALCPALRNRALEEARMVFSKVPALDAEGKPDTSKLILPDPANPHEMAKALAFVPVIDAWCREVEGYAQRHLERGGFLPGYKLVRKRANRRWKDEAGLIAALKEKGVTEADYLVTPEVKSPAQLEKLKALGRNEKERKAWTAAYAEKPEGGLTVATEGDPREAVPAPVLTTFSPVGTLPAGAEGVPQESVPQKSAPEILL